MKPYLDGPNIIFTSSSLNSTNPKNITIYEDDPLPLNCDIQSYPTKTAKLYFNGILLEQSSSLRIESSKVNEFRKINYIIDKITRKNNGTYECGYYSSESGSFVSESIDIYVFC